MILYTEKDEIFSELTLFDINTAEMGGRGVLAAPPLDIILTI